MSKQEGRIRKQMYDLTAKDFRDHAVWEFCLDEEEVEGQDETTVGPASLSEVPRNSFGSFLVAAEVTFGDGSKRPGYLFSCEGDVILASPGVFVGTRGTHFQIPGSLTPERAEQLKKRLYADLEMDSEAVFPVMVTSLVKVSGEPMRFALDGFVINGGPRRGQTIR